MSGPGSPARGRQQQLARWARRAPGYELVRTTVLPRVRRSDVLSDLAWRVFAPRHGAGQVDVPLHAGRHLTGPDTRLLPVVGVLALGLEDVEASRLMDRLAELQREHRSFRPLLVLDTPAFAAARRHGFVLELVLPRGAWEGSDQEWSSYLATRLVSLVERYQLWHLVHADAGRLSGLDENILRALGACLPELDVRPVADDVTTMEVS